MNASRERDKNQSKKLPLKLALRTSILYVVVAGLWIILSDRILQPLAPFVETYVHWQTIKGLLFVTVTGALLFFSMRTQLRKIQQAEADRVAVGIHFYNLLAESTDAIINIDHEQRITYFNKGAETIFGYKLDEILGQLLDNLLPERFVVSHREHVRKFAESDETSLIMRTIAARRRNGEEFIAEATATKHSENGDLVFTVILRDISEREKAERKIRRHLARANALAEIAARINANLDLSLVLEAICEEMAKALDVRATMVTLYDQKKT
jgi:PAS domain S-box-containing protein